MTDAQDLASRYLNLWEEYLTAVLTDPAAPLLAGWPSGRQPPNECGPDGPDYRDRPVTGSSIGAAAAAGASDECCGAVVELARRVAALEVRIATLERAQSKAARARRRNRRVRG